MNNNLQKFIELEFKSLTFNTLDNIVITPVIAEALLSFNTNNIPPAPNKIQQYAISMEEGRWKLNGDSIRFSNDGVLLDGQNRLLACIAAKSDFVTNIVVGLEPEVFNTIDQGRVRRQSQLLAREYADDISPQEATLISAAILRILKHEHGYSQGSSIQDIRSTTKSSFSAEEVSTYLANNKRIVEEARIVRAQFGSRAILPQPMILFLMHLGNKFNKGYTTRFLDKLIRGIGLIDGETLMHLNQILIQIKSKGTRWSPTERDNTIIKVWGSVGRNGLHSIVHKNNMKVRKGDPIPFLTEPKPESIKQMLS